MPARKEENEGRELISKVIDGILGDLKNISKHLESHIKCLDIKKCILMNIPYIATGYVFNLAARLYRLAPGDDISAKSMVLINSMNELFSRPFPSFHPADLGVGIACGAVLKIIVMQKAKNAKKFRQGVEYGSARWGNAKDIEPYMDSVFENNVLLTQTERLMMSGRPKEPQ